MAKDYYNILGVSKNASRDDIKKAFHRLAHKYHPDKAGGDEARFKEINEAYQVLSNEQKRSQYDNFGTTYDMGGRGGAGFGGFQGGQGFGGFSAEGFDFDLGDIFGDFFGGGRKQKTRKGSDIHIDMTVDLAEAAFGIKKTIALKKAILCSACRGTGGEPGSGAKTCVSCDGKGQVVKVQATILGQFQTSSTCQVCSGHGTVPGKLCRVCHGAGIVKETNNIDVRVPAGIEDGQMIRITGEGEVIGKGGQSGDLLITMHVRPHPLFTREGHHLKTTAHISFSAATLGGSVNIKSLDDKTIKLKISAGTESGKVFRIPGKGVASISSVHRGDLLVTVHVKTPGRLTRKQKKLLEDLRDEGL